MERSAADWEAAHAAAEVTPAIADEAAARPTLSARSPSPAADPPAA
jgi:hypothetical protein